MPRFLVEREERTFVDAEGVVIHFHVWTGVAPKAILVLAHGVGEYAERYEPFAQDLVNAGYAVWAIDQRGHGRTGVEQHGGDLKRLGRLGPGGIRAVVADLVRLVELVKTENPDVPIALAGHSWGSLIVQLALNGPLPGIDAVVLSGTAFRTFRHMNGGDLAKRHRGPGGTGVEWLSRDPEVGARFLADPLTFDAKVRKLFGVREALRLLGKPERMAKDVPLLIQIGSDDTLGGPESIRLLADAYRSAGLTDVTEKVYEGARHEVYNETNRDEVIADLVDWLDAHLKYVPPRRRR
jgi:alpha-beta hydrolase superfamily lysophospholipase